MFENVVTGEFVDEITPLPEIIDQEPTPTTGVLAFSVSIDGTENPGGARLH
jgi:hypothetical protein